MAYEVVDFQDILDAIREELKVQSGDTVTINRIKRVVNRVYLQEVVPFARWKWLEGSYRVIHKARYNAGTAALTPGTTSVTISIVPPVSAGSFVGKKFSADGYNEVYIIDSHTAGSDTFTISSPYTGNYTLAVGYKIWDDIVNLPTDCRETVNVWHNFSTKPMEGVGLQKFRQFTALNPKMEGYPQYYYTADFHDPTTLTVETESDRYRRMYVYPAINKTDVTLQIDYVKEVAPLTDPGDEPVLPLEDRGVLVDGALARLWKSVASDNENAELSKRDYEAKLARMAGKIEDSQDTAKVTPASTYVRARRAPRVRPGSFAEPGVNGGSGYEPISYLEDVTIKGGQLTANLAVNAGVTIDGVDVSVLDATVTAHINQISDAHDASAISVVPAGAITATDVQAALVELDDDLTNHLVDTTDAHDASAISFDNTGTGITATDVQAALAELDTDIVGTNNLTDGKIWVGNSSNVAAEVTPSGDATISNTGVISISSDVIVDADIKSNAAISRSKLAALTVNRVIVSDGSGIDSASAITSTELTYLDDVAPLTTESLLDATTAVIPSLTHVAATYPVISIHYSIIRGAGNIESGIINIVNDGTNVAIAQGAVASLGTVGITIAAAINGTNVEVSYAATSTGTNATMKYKLHKWG